MSFNGSKEAGIVWILLVLFFHIIHATERLYNFKYQAVEILIGEDDGITSAPPLPIPLPFCKQKTTSSIYVCTNGIIAFGEEYCPFEVGKYGDEFATTNPVIAPFYSDITLAPASFAVDSGNIKSALHLYGNSSNEIFKRANNDIQYFLNGSPFDSVLVYIATWFGVRAWGAKERATFQVAIITDGLRSFVRFSYQEMLWQSVLKNVQVGFKLDDSRDCEKVVNISITGYDPFTYPLDKVKGNTGEKGVWMFEITKDKFPVGDLKSITVTVLALGKVLVKTGERVFLFCHLSKNSNITYLWYKNGVLLEKENKSMIVKDFTLNDAGRYQCKISHLNNVQSSINSVAISVVFSDVPTLSFLPHSSSPVNASIVLSCDIKAYPRPVISWHKDGIFLKEGIMPVFVIPTIASSHAGSYQCIATSVNGRIASEAKDFGITSSTGKVSHGSITVNGVNVTLTCIHEKYVNLLLTWEKKMNLNSSEPVVYFADVTIKTIQDNKQDSGEYVCELFQENQHEISIFLQLFEEAIVSSLKSNITSSIKDVHFSCAKQPFNSISYKWNITFYGLFVWEGVKYNVKSSFFQDSKAGKCTASFSDGDNKTKSVDIVIKYINTPQIQLSNNDTLSEGEILSMVCIVEGTPHIYFKWWKDGIFLKYNSSNITLTIYHNDSGLYKCKVENDAGSKFSNGYLLNVTYLDEPELIIQTGSSLVIEGSNFTFQCISSGSSDHSYLWLKDNTVLNTTDEFLNFKTVSRFDEGNYQCQVSNSIVKKFTEKKFLEVAYLEQPFIQSSHNLSSLIFGHKLILTCNSSGNPKIVYKWLKNEEVLSNNKELIIESVDENTKGSYVCNVSNGFMTTSSIVYLNAHYIKTLQLRLLSNQTVKEGDSLSMVCEVEDSSPVHIKWWKDGRSLNHTSSVIVFNVNRNDSGVYKCLAENEAGPKISNEHFVDIMYLDKPSIIIQHASSIPVEGSSMTIQCKSAGSPPLSYMWLKEDMLLNYTNEFLTFEKVMQYDKGKYQCKVSNPAASKFTNVALIEIAYLDQPLISSSHNISSLIFGRQLSLICKALGYPMAVYQWIKNEEVVSNSEKLIFESVNENTQGSYTCDASNGYIRKSNSVYLGAQYIKTPQLRFSNVETIIEGDSLSMFCEVESTPPVYFKWWKNGNVLNHTSSTIILKINRNYSGIYQCQAGNDAGIKLSNEHPLNVMYMDQPVISKSVSKYSEGDSLLISCSANANPPRSNSSYSWKSNGQLIAHGAYLKLKNVTKKDSGVYECLVRNSVGVSKGEIIDIQYLDEPNLLVQQGNIIIEGNSLILHCISAGSLPLSYIWIKDNILLNYTNEYLQFHAITRHEQGKYQCKVSNHVTSKLSSVKHIEVVYLEQPFITMSQDPSMLTEGHQLRLICDAPGSMKVDYQWIKNNEVLSNNKELFFERFNKIASGNYVCNVSNGYIRKFSFVQLVAHFVGVPTLELFPSSSVNEGTSLLIMCHENSSDSVNYTWYRDGNKLSKSSKYMHMVASRNSSGIYICETSNKYSSKISKGQYLDVFYLSSPFISEGKIVIYQNQSTNVSCSSNSYPDIVYTWKKNGRVVSQSSLLVISNTNFDSVGVYECYVENVVGQKMTAITVELQYLEKPNVLVHPSAVLLEGNSLLLTCSAVGSGKLRYFWATDGVIFAKESPYKVLENLNRYDKSKVSCIVKNDLESKTSDELTLDIFYLDRPIIKSSAGLDFVKLNCTSNGNPPPNFAWYHQGVFISNQSFLEIVKSNVSEYLCVAKNKVGEKSISTVGAVYTNRRVIKPLLEILPSISPKEGDSVVMFCETDDSKSIKFEWFKEKLELPGNSQILLINKVNRTDSGSYQCKVLYDQDIAFSAAVHMVVQYLDEPFIKLLPPAQFIMAGDNVEMKCVSSAEEALNFYWYHNNRIISNSSILNLEATTVKNEGEYFCEISGEVGSKKSSKTIKIHFMYEPSVQFVPSTSILEGNTVVMICHENSSDSVNYTWFKDNKVIGESSKLFFVVSTKRTDNVLYKCKTSNQYASEFSSDYKLNVNYLDKPIITELEMLDTIAFNCTADGNPAPNYTWLYHGIIVSNKTQIVVSGLNDSYVCSVLNKVAHYSVSTVIKEKASNGLVLSVMPSDVIEEGSAVIMTCEVEGLRPVKYLWYKNSMLLAGNSLMKVFVKVTRVDDGVYQCAALYNQGMKNSNEVFMKVEYLEEPVITLSKPNKLVFINDSIQLSCSSLASSAISYQWKFGAKILSTSSVLELNNIKKEDSREYVCETFANRGLRRKTSKVVIVHYLDEPLLTASPSNNLRAESSLTLTCKVNSSEPISYSWTKNNLEMNSHHEVIVFDKIDHHADKGAYSCTASNRFGLKRSNKLQISINYLETPVINKVVKDGFIYLTCFAEGYPPPQHVWKLHEMNLTNNATLQVEISKSYKNEYECTAFNEYYTKSAFSSGIKMYLSTPFVTVFPTGNINRGSAVVLTCSINGLKPLRYGWYKDNKILFGEYESMLLLESIQINDGGEYKCTVANNITSKTSKSRKLSVFYIGSPEIGLSKVTLNEGQNFSLPCRCFGNPSDIEYRWVKGVEEVVLSNTSMLMLQDIHGEDSGTYKCICKNLVSKTFQDLQVNINYLGLPSVYTTSSNTSKEGDSVTMYCLSNGTLPLTYKWKKNKSYIKQQGNILLLHKVDRNDSGLYSCEVFNSVGSQISNAVNLSVSFLTKPIILSKTEYLKGDTVNLTCIATGYPTVTFKWTKDNNFFSLKHQLVIQNVDVNDEATFGCEVTNNIEVKTTFFILKVICKFFI